MKGKRNSKASPQTQEQGEETTPTTTKKKTKPKKPPEPKVIYPKAVLINRERKPPRKYDGKFQEHYGEQRHDEDGSEIVVKFIKAIRDTDATLYATMFREWRFHLGRLWKFDLAWPDYKVAIDIQGGVYMRGGGGHTTGKGYEDDCEKSNEALLKGWVLLRYGPSHVRGDETINTISQVVSVLRERGWPDTPTNPMQKVSTYEIALKAITKGLAGEAAKLRAEKALNHFNHQNSKGIAD